MPLSDQAPDPGRTADEAIVTWTKPHRNLP